MAFLNNALNVDLDLKPASKAMVRMLSWGADLSLGGAQPHGAAFVERAVLGAGLQDFTSLPERDRRAGRGIRRLASHGAI